MAKTEIKEGDPQPLDCPVCKSKRGYQVSQLFHIYSDTVYDKNGIYSCVIDAEYRKPIRTLKETCCANCRSKLPFKIV